jgi:Mrp family chromosome partitioning ATPase
MTGNIQHEREKDMVAKATGYDSSSAVQEKQPEEREQDFLDPRALKLRISQIQHKNLVLSGKGGVGNSTIAIWRI